MAPLAKIRCEQAFCLDFHPSRPVLAAALITGQLKLYDCAGQRPTRLASSRPHKGACRAVRFAADGATVFSGGSDATLQQRDVETNTRVWGKRAAHPAPINAIRLVSDTGVASGDDDGLVRVWDVRQRSCALEFTEHTEMITDLLYVEKGKCLVSTSTDGYLAVYDLRRGRLDARSDNQAIIATPFSTWRPPALGDDHSPTLARRRTSCSASHCSKAARSSHAPRRRAWWASGRGDHSATFRTDCSATARPLMRWLRSMIRRS